MTYEAQVTASLGLSGTFLFHDADGNLVGAAEVTGAIPLHKYAFEMDPVFKAWWDVHEDDYTAWELGGDTAYEIWTAAIASTQGAPDGQLRE
jgi:hypothetical protein